MKNLTREDYEDLKSTRIEELTMGLAATSAAMDCHYETLTGLIEIIFEHLPEEAKKQAEQFVNERESVHNSILKYYEEVGEELEHFRNHYN